MKFSDNKNREYVIVLMTEKEYRDRNLDQDYNAEILQTFRKNNELYYYVSISSRDLKIGESIYNKKRKFLAYRVN